jgi:brefeldin A-resistance guanine nucleotide exchange factor 1
MFSLAHSYGNILREGWKDLLDCLLALFKARLLPEAMVEVRGQEGGGGGSI